MGVPVDARLGTAIMRLVAGQAPERLPRHRHDLTRDQVHEAQTARIVAAAIELFAADGFANTTVQRIAERAAVSRKTFYQFYNSREAVFVDAYTAAVRALISAISEEDRADPPLDPQRIIASGVQRILGVLASEPAATRVFFLEALGAGPAIRARRNEAIDEFVSALVPLAAAVRTDAGDAAAGRVAVHIAVAACIELITEHVAVSPPESLRQLAPTLSQAISIALRP